MTPGGRPTALLAPLLTIWPTNTGLYLHALFPPPLQARGGKEAPDRGGGPDIPTQVRRDQLSPRVVRAVGWASSLNSTVLLWCVM